MEVPMALPDPSSLSPGLLGFLDDHFKTLPDLTSASSLAAKLRSDCCDSEGDLIDLKTKLSSLLSLWTSLSNDVSDLLDRIDSDLCFSPDGYEEVDFGRVERALCVELPLLAKEVRRVETVRSYVETALRLESLVGDLEDAAYSSLSQNMRATLSNASTPIDIGSKQENLLLAIKAMKNIEEVLVRITNCRPQWTHLLNAVDSRVDKTLCLLRPHAIMDHRTVLSSLGWPPQLSASNLENGKSSELPNPLVLMQGDKKEMYAQSFLTLCSLQHLQAQREARQEDLNFTDIKEPCKKTYIDCSLWATDELVSAISSSMDKHFSKWIDEPKFIFALVYKVTRDFVEGVDDVLQPLIDKARLVGRSAKEAWVSSMVKMLFKYLKTKCFSAFMDRYHNTGGDLDSTSSWLHLVDLIITFDKRMRAIIISGTPVMESSLLPGGISGTLSLLSMFCDLPDWLGIWSDIELKDAEEKLKSELDNERAWKIDLKQEHENFTVQDELYLLSSREDYRAPLIAETVFKIAWTMMERCQSLPNMCHQIQFIRSSTTKFLHTFFNTLHQCYYETEWVENFIDDNSLLRLSGAINAARYSESILHEWSEDIRFLEMKALEDDGIISGPLKDDSRVLRCFFADEIEVLLNLETDFVEEIVSSLLTEFDSLSSNYIQNKEQWIHHASLDSNISISSDLIEPLDMLRNRLRVLNASLNVKDFFDIWRCVAGGIDHFIFTSILSSDVVFSVQGAHQFTADMQALFQVFKSFCPRPGAFFPCLSDLLKLLTLTSREAKQLLELLSKNEEEMESQRRLGVHCVSSAQAEKVLKNLRFENQC
ncbi:hypothetical protein QJS10_CPA16g01230 [Acorus calamus]|uniref:RINT1-like protein MAG2L n=1 Tax=Acorus calamus TaxID=4465 RepID=A0AAV9D2U5_ACOCL|nr:hypothetical protein QJS10_CPA16g01230 [Acorus calamus]